MFSHNGPHELVVTCDIGHNLRERRAGGSSTDCQRIRHVLQRQQLCTAGVIDDDMSSAAIGWLLQYKSRGRSLLSTITVFILCMYLWLLFFLSMCCRFTLPNMHLTNSAVGFLHLTKSSIETLSA